MRPEYKHERNATQRLNEHEKLESPRFQYSDWLGKIRLMTNAGTRYAVTVTVSAATSRIQI